MTRSAMLFIGVGVIVWGLAIVVLCFAIVTITGERLESLDLVFVWAMSMKVGATVGIAAARRDHDDGDPRV